MIYNKFECTAHKKTQSIYEHLQLCALLESQCSDKMLYGERKVSVQLCSFENIIIIFFD